MTKQELLEYLGTVCDAENAIYSCNEMILALKREKSHVPHAAIPSKPVRYVNNASSHEQNEGSGTRRFLSVLLGWVIGIGAFFILGLIIFPSIEWVADTPTLAALLCAIPIGIGSKWAVHLKMESNHDTQIHARLQADADHRYQSQMKQYDDEYKAYLKAKEIEDRAIQILDQSIDAQNRTISRLNEHLKALYENDVIYPSCRGIIAVNAIREYLVMGICDTLDGPDGAYAQYMQDVRVNRICTSIDDMKKQLVHSMQAIASTQGALLHEMRTTNNNILDMQGSISTGFSRLGTSLHEYQRAAANNLSASSAQLTNLNNLLTNISSATQTTAHNQYIAAREANIQGYLLRRP